MASAAFHFDAQGSLLKIAVAAGGTTTATIDSSVGVSSIAWSLVSSDENGTAGWSLSASSGSSTIVTAPSSVIGRAVLLKCIANGGSYTGLNGTQATGDLVKTAKVYVAPEVGAAGEGTESDSVYGSSGIVNRAIRATGGGSVRPRFNIATGAQITSNQNDYSPAGASICSLVRVSSDAARDITGLSVDGFAAVAGDMLTLVNVGGFAITLRHENAGSSAANRFSLASAADHALSAGSSCILYYDGASTRWRNCSFSV